MAASPLASVSEYVDFFRRRTIGRRVGRTVGHPWAMLKWTLLAKVRNVRVLSLASATEASDLHGAVFCSFCHVPGGLSLLL